MEYARSNLRPLHEKLKKEALAGTGKDRLLIRDPSGVGFRALGTRLTTSEREILRRLRVQEATLFDYLRRADESPFGASGTPRGDNPNPIIPRPDSEILPAPIPDKDA